MYLRDLQKRKRISRPAQRLKDYQGGLFSLELHRHVVYLCNLRQFRSWGDLYIQTIVRYVQHAVPIHVALAAAHFTIYLQPYNYRAVRVNL